MPINWNEINKLKLEYIQNKEAAKTKYEKDLKAYKEKKKNSNFITRLFNGTTKPKELKEENFIYCYPCEDWIIKIYDDVIGIRINSLQESIVYDKIKNLNVTRIYKDNVNTTYCIDDNEENRKKSSEIANIVEEYENNMNIFRQESMKMFKEFCYKN